MYVAGTSTDLKVLMLQAEKDSLPVTDEEVEAELEQRIRYFVGQVGTIEALEEMAGKNGLPDKR
jgi:peptidyl-prolyl cis-trans isomerase SurA